MRPPLIARALGIILIAYGCVLLLPALLAWIVDENLAILPFVVAASTGMCCFWYGRDHRDFDQLRRTEGLSIVALTWTLAGLFGGVPYLFFGLSPLDALFESVSGITTTGATILTDFSLYPRAFFFWRSFSQ